MSSVKKKAQLRRQEEDTARRGGAQDRHEGSLRATAEVQSHPATLLRTGPPSPRTPRALRQHAVGSMQRSHGNARVQRWIAERSVQRSGLPSGPRVVQRGWLDTAGDVLSAVGKGIYSVGEDLVGGVKRTGRGLNPFNTKEQLRIAGENERAYGILKRLVQERGLLEDLASVVIEYWYDELPEERQAKVREAMERMAMIGGGYLGGRMVIGKHIATLLARRIAARIAATQTFKLLATRLGVSAAAGATGIGIPITLLMIQGTLERAGQASRRLAADHPKLYALLKQQELDMAWFLIEPHLDELRAQFVEKIRELESQAPEVKVSPMGDYPLPTGETRMA